MAKSVIIKQNIFSGGVAEDPRENSSTKCVICKHFDIFSQPSRLLPYRNLVADTNDGSTSTGMKQYQVQDMVYASSSAKLYGMGKNASGHVKIVYKSDATVTGWTLPSSSEGTGAVKYGCFVEYKDYMWFFQGTNQVSKWGLLSGTPSITNSVSTTASTITSVAQGIIAKDDNLYLPYNNIIARVTSSGTFNDAVLTLPTNFKITSIDNYGNYLAIACAPISTFNGVSKVFLWNLTSTDVQEAYDLGAGEVRVLGVIEGMIVTVSDVYLNNAVGAGTGSMVIKVLQGSSFQPLKEIFTKSLVGKVIPIYKSIKNNRLFFSAKITTNSSGTEYNEGIWSFGRKNASSDFALSLDIIDESVSATYGIDAFSIAGNYFYIAHSADGSIDSTSSTATYTYSSIYETLIYNFGSIDNDKRLESVKVFFRRLASGESLTVKYKVDDETSWNTIGTYSTVNTLSRTFLNIESTGAHFASGKEFKFQIISNGGAEILGYECQATLLNVP